MRNRPRRSLGHVFGAGSATEIERGSRRQAWARRGAVPGREPDLALVALPDFLRQQILRKVFGNRDARFHHTRGDSAEDSTGGLENRLKGVARLTQLRRWNPRRYRPW